MKTGYLGRYLCFTIISRQNERIDLDFHFSLNIGDYRDRHEKDKEARIQSMP
jgi:hypothetical protein